MALYHPLISLQICFDEEIGGGMDCRSEFFRTIKVELHEILVFRFTVLLFFKISATIFEYRIFRAVKRNVILLHFPAKKGGGS